MWKYLVAGCQCADECVCRLCMKLPTEWFWLIQGADIWIEQRLLLCTVGVLIEDWH